MPRWRECKFHPAPDLYGLCDLGQAEGRYESCRREACLILPLVDAVEAQQALVEHQAICELCFGIGKPCDRACALTEVATRTRLDALAAIAKARGEE